MWIHIGDQLRASLGFFVLGAVAGALYDLFRLFGMIAGAVRFTPPRFARLFEKSKKTESPRLVGAPFRFAASSAVFLFDLFFCTLAAAAFSVASYVFCGGAFRLYALCFSAFGFIFYSALPGRLIRTTHSPIAYVVRFAVRSAVNAAVFPLRIVLRFVRRVLKSAISATRIFISGRVAVIRYKRNFRSAVRRMDVLVRLPLPSPPGPSSGAAGVPD